MLSHRRVVRAGGLGDSRWAVPRCHGRPHWTMARARRAGDGGSVKDRTNISARTRRLCMVLRRLRAESGLTSTQVAHRIGVVTSVISRAESGKRPISADDLAALLTVYGVSRPLRRALLKLHADADTPDLLDRGELHLHDDLAKWIGFEEDAIQIHNYEPLLVPGLLQTFPYARAVITGADLSLTEQEVDDRVAARIARQTLLRRPRPPQLDVVLHEAALRQQVGGPAAMRDQLGYLLEAAFRPAVTIRVIPLNVGAHPGMSGPFVIMDYPELPSLVLLENKVASLYLEEPADVEVYRLTYNGLMAVAYSPERSIELITAIAKGMV
jgi:transcriptional regulator with XRE-family HTH domain